MKIGEKNKQSDMKKRHKRRTWEAWNGTMSINISFRIAINALNRQWTKSYAQHIQRKDSFDTNTSHKCTQKSQCKTHLFKFISLSINASWITTRDNLVVSAFVVKANGNRPKNGKTEKECTKNVISGWKWRWRKFPVAKITDNIISAFIFI